MHQVGGMGIHRWQLMIIWDNTLSVPVVYLDLSANSRLLIGIAMSVEKKKNNSQQKTCKQMALVYFVLRKSWQHLNKSMSPFKEIL